MRTRKSTLRKQSEEPCDGHTEGEGEGDSSHYEQIRDQRIKENMERMHNLGLFNLSLKLKAKPFKKKNKTTLHVKLSPQRRSSRIMSLAPVNYSDNRHKEKKEIDIFIAEGANPEVYTEEQEKLLGDCETTWELFVDGYDVDGNRIYDPIKGETCHQCRQKTLGQHTSCNKCELPQGQFCGDCLYMSYGENVMEANQNSKWSCPPCRGICNCSRCRREKGWMPTGNIYNKVLKLGFKSVAHYLIKTHRSELGLEGSGAENSVGEEISETSADTMLIRPTRTRRALEFGR
ncbi:cell division cycle-associated 7-like protein [Abrus precatorius]|uniref:Cell division cycle-associated 7-like protein n=1 Tax=Abrus precatorius TaxID=3816 RepID=A0A8B8L103_ABRPR|nr:cell division cycle-associated 7-like protein [Abrus precatorius]